MSTDFPLKVKGIIQKEDMMLKVIYSNDFINYYKWLIEQHFKVLVNTPMHGAHSTLVDSRYTPNVSEKILNRWHNTPVEVYYNPYIHVGGKYANFTNYWVKIYSPILDVVAKNFNVSSRAYHITIANTKYSQHDPTKGIRPNFGSIIKIR